MARPEHTGPPELVSVSYACCLSVISCSFHSFIMIKKLRNTLKSERIAVIYLYVRTYTRDPYFIHASSYLCANCKPFLQSNARHDMYKIERAASHRRH